MTNVSSWAELAAIADALDGDYVLTANLGKGTAGYTGVGDAWIPIGASGTEFTGTFDGNGFTISDLYCYKATDYAGLFGKASAATFTDILLDNFFIKGVANYVGGICGYAATSTFAGCHLTNGELQGLIHCGGILGSTATSIIDCHYSGVMQCRDTSGGIAGGGVSTITSCTFTGDIIGTNAQVFGGIVGNDNVVSAISYCEFLGTIYGVDYSGGIAGDISAGATVVSYCKAKGKIVTHTSGNCGGIVANLQHTNAVVKKCYADVDIWSSGSNTGGVIGNCTNGTVEDCYSTGTIQGQVGVGGFCGNVADACVKTWKNCWTTAIVIPSDKDYADLRRIGGFIGDSGGITIQNCGWLKQPSYRAQLNAIGDSNGGTKFPLLTTTGKGYDADTIDQFYDKTYGVFSTWLGTDWVWTKHALPTFRHEYNVWSAAGAGDFSNVANWSRAMTLEDKVLFNNTSDQNCTIDEDTRLKTFIIEDGYDGTITQEADLYVNEYSQADGTFQCALPFDYKFKAARTITITAGTFDRAT